MLILSRSAIDMSEVQPLEYKLAPATNYTELSGTDEKVIELNPNKIMYPSKYTG